MKCCSKGTGLRCFNCYGASVGVRDHQIRLFFNGPNNMAQIMMILIPAAIRGCVLLHFCVYIFFCATARFQMDYDTSGRREKRLRGWIEGGRCRNFTYCNIRCDTKYSKIIQLQVHSNLNPLYQILWTLSAPRMSSHIGRPKLQMDVASRSSCASCKNIGHATTNVSFRMRTVPEPSEQNRENYFCRPSFRS